jgi:hypothetical protein
VAGMLEKSVFNRLIMDDDCNRWERVEFYEPKICGKPVLKKVGSTTINRLTLWVTEATSLLFCSIFETIQYPELYIVS